MFMPFTYEFDLNLRKISLTLMEQSVQNITTTIRKYPQRENFNDCCGTA